MRNAKHGTACPEVKQPHAAPVSAVRIMRVETEKRLWRGVSLHSGVCHSDYFPYLCLCVLAGMGVLPQPALVLMIIIDMS